MTRRPQKMAASMQRELGLLLARIDLPVLTTISKVEVSPDLKNSKVWITIFSNSKQDEQEVLEILKDNLYELQGEINRYFKSRNVPRIVFEIDNSLRYASRINSLLKEI